MLRLGPVNLQARPALAAVVTSEKDIESVDHATLREIDVFEIRADLFSEPTVQKIRTVLRAGRRRNKGVLLTIRSPEEGGREGLTEEVRIDLYQNLLADCDALDFEVTSEGLWKDLASLCTKEGRLLIGSYHDFQGTPHQDRMDEVLHNAFSKGASLFKIACMASNSLDVVRLLDFTRMNAERGMISLSMGPWGLMSRVMAPAFGSLMTYGFLSESSAPGQLSVRALARHLREFLPSRVG